jgi:RNA polymerase sigma factor (sigma-70 family)
MRIPRLRNRFPHLKQDYFTLMEERCLDHDLGSLGRISRFIQAKISRLEKMYRTLEGAQGGEDAHGSCSLDRKELVTILSQLISELSPQQKILFSLYYREGLNFKEIGEVLGYSEMNAIRLFEKGLKEVDAKIHLRAGN